MVDVAQLVESRIVIPVVVGSSPIVHPTKFKHLALNGLGAFPFMGYQWAVVENNPPATQPGFELIKVMRNRNGSDTRKITDCINQVPRLAQSSPPP